MLNRFRVLALSCVLLLLALPLGGALPQSNILDISDTKYTNVVDLSPFTVFLEDVDGLLTPEALVSSDDFLPLEGSANFGFTDSVYWFRTSVRNLTAENAHQLLEVSYPLLEHIDAYLFDGKKQIRHMQAGLAYPESAGNFNYRFPVIPLDMEPDSHLTLLLRVKTDSSMQVPLSLWTEKGFAENVSVEQFIFGLYYGAIFALLAYNLLLTPWLRDRVYVYVYYVGYLGFFALFQMIINGYTTQYLWPKAGSVVLHALPSIIFLAAFFAHRFSSGLLEVEKHLPRHWPYMRVLTKVIIVSLIATPFLPYHIKIHMAISTVLAMMYYFYVAILSYRAGVEAARYYLLAWTTFLIGVGIYALKAQGLIPANAITEYTLQVGSVMEALLLSFALASRFKSLKDENERIQSEAKQNLEVRVEERTKELKDVLDELSVANARLESLNNTDALTGVNNRAFFESHFDYVWNNTARANEHISIMMIDVDHFKSINDTYGHLIGDEVLVAVAQTIQKSLSRNTDQMARYGGEEFVVVLPSTRSDGAGIVAERIRAAVAEVNTSMFGLMDNVTVSIGVTTVSPTYSDLSPRELINQADRALYHAKHTGRNRVAIFDPDWGDEENTAAA